MPIRVFLLEDHAITLWGLQRLIEGRSDEMQVVGTASSRDSLLAHAALPLAQVLVMDLNLADEDGLDLLPEVLQHHRAQVLVLTGSDDVQRHCRAIELGARGLLHKSEAPQQILAAIRQVHAGGAWMSPQLMGQVLGLLAERRPRADNPSGPEQARILNLTTRERDIIRLLSQHPSEKLVHLADKVGLSDSTLRNHLTAIYAKLGLRGRLELHVFADRHGLKSS